MDKNPAKASVGGVEEIISELHERGVRSGKEQSERILAEARLEASEIIKSAESEQMLQAFLASLPEIFERRAMRLLDAILDTAFDPQRGSDTIDRFVSFLDDDTTAKVRQFFASAEPQSFVEGLLVLATAFYADAKGIEHFALDPNLKRAWAKVMGSPESNVSLAYEFRDGIVGFTLGGKDGREIAVSPESIKHMVQAWAGEEFRDLYMTLQPRPVDEKTD